MRADAGHRETPGDPLRDLHHLLVGDGVERLDRLVGIDVLPEDRPSAPPRAARPRSCSRTPARAARPRRRAPARPPPRTARRSAARRRSRASACRPRRTSSSPGPPTAAGSARRRTCGRPRRPSTRARAARGSRRTAASPSSRPAASSRPTARRARPARGSRSPAGRTSAGATGWNRAARPASSARTAAPAPTTPLAEIDGKRPNSSAISLFSGTWSRLPTRNAPPRAPTHWRRRKARIASRVKVRRCSAGPSTGRPSGCSPNAARSIRCSATTDGWSCARAISWITTPRSRSSSSASIFGRPTKSVSRSIASATTSARHVMWNATRSCDVYAFRTAPIVSAV